MTRRLLAFFAPALLMAQTKAKPHYTIDRIEEPPSQAFPRSNPRPRNGQCPVCGTMAQPFTMAAKIEASLRDACDWLAGDQPIDVERVKKCRDKNRSLVPPFRRIDCAHCNTTFRQWAEGKEPKR